MILVRLFLQVKKVYDFACGTTIRVLSSISPLQARKRETPAASEQLKCHTRTKLMAKD